VQSKKSDKDIMILVKVSYYLPVDKVQQPRELEPSEKRDADEATEIATIEICDIR
jgi:hypothetical protein